jgi:hypothetical protein
MTFQSVSPGMNSMSTVVIYVSTARTLVNESHAAQHFDLDDLANLGNL